MILEGVNLDFSYGETPALKGVSVTIGGGVTAVIGPNASGKSTLLRCLCGLLRPRGKALLDGVDVARLKAPELARRVSYLSQGFWPQAFLTVFEFVLLGRLHQLSWRVSAVDVDCVNRLLREFGIADLASRRITEVSGGQAQMAAIAQALAREPQVLLLDEPTSNLDMKHQFETGELLRALAGSRGISVVVALHDLNLAARFADVVYVLNDGRVHSSGSPAETLTAEMIASVYGVSARIGFGDDGRPEVIPLRVAQPDATR
ncbi:MAG TPA: ABC transporter ATP-binding protein [Candidatus Brocadiia bacterium]|nr:ABC transporter ATP-binding protein [Candidatus Brocadiia bacterium]